MNSSKVFSFILFLFFSFQFSPSQNRHLQPCEKVILCCPEVKNLYKIDHGVYRSGQPSSSGFQQIESYGIREILSLRNYHSDNSQTKGSSLQLHRLRSRASTIDQFDIITALRIIKDRQGAILFHCWHGSDRTGAVAAMYRIVFQGWSKEAAIDEMINGGFGFHPQFDEIPAMIHSSDITYIKLSLGFTLPFD